jgi:RimJ/RimL family protein N-acetyltransferase
MTPVGIEQPQFIPIDVALRLRAYDGDYRKAVAWYRDPVVYRNSEGITDEARIPDDDYVRRMYEYLSKNGELYFIEVLEDGEFIPVGDVPLKEENPSIAIGVPQYRGMGIGKKVMTAIIARARELGIARFYGTKIYDYNIASQKLFESLGFRCVRVEGNTRIYELELDRAQ